MFSQRDVCQTRDTSSHNVAHVNARGCASVSFHFKADVPDPQCCGCWTKETVGSDTNSKMVTNVLTFDSQVWWTWMLYGMFLESSRSPGSSSSTKRKDTRGTFHSRTIPVLEISRACSAREVRKVWAPATTTAIGASALSTSSPILSSRSNGTWYVLLHQILNSSRSSFPLSLNGS